MTQIHGAGIGKRNRNGCVLVVASLLVLGLLFPGVAQAQEYPPMPTEAHEQRAPTRFVKVEGISWGVLPWARCVWSEEAMPPFLSARIAKVTVVLNRLRFGASFVDSYSTLDDWGGDMKWPLHVGYTLFSLPRRNWLFWSAVPDVSVEASGSLWRTNWQVSDLACTFGPGVRAALCCDVDYCGVGTGLEVGWVLFDRTPRISFLYAGLQLRLATFGIGF